MRSKQILARALRCGALMASLSLTAAFVASAGEPRPFIPVLVNSSTIPVNGDLNPYGVAFVPEGFPSGGAISTGDVLVSNFNDSKNTEGTGTTIIKLTPSGPLAPPGSAITFFSSALPGLSTALGVLRAGFVIVGNVPTTDGTFATIGQGALQVINGQGKLLQTLTDPVFLDGPWDLALDDHGATAHIFVSNVLNGTVSRLDVAVEAKGLNLLKKTTIALGYTHVPSVPAVVLGPTGLAYDDSTGTLYVASTADNAIYAVVQAASRTTPVNRGSVVFEDPHLIGPLALRFAPNGDLLTANGDATANADPEHPSEIIEFTKGGTFVREYNVDATEGGAFGLDTVLDNDQENHYQENHSTGFNYAAVDDVTNNLSVYHLPVH
jgi:DNA-binding beta-propeller fold protein YncE